MDYKRASGMALIAIALLILLYVSFNVVNTQADTLKNDGLTTEYALYGEVSDSLQTQGFAIREEKVINPSYTGVLNYRVASGARIYKGGVIADIFQTEADAAAQNMADRIEREIQSLSALTQPVDYNVSASTAMGEQIYDNLDGILGYARRGDFSGVAREKESLLLSLSRKQILSGQESADDYAQRVNELSLEMAGLSGAKAVNSIKAPQAGYFVTFSDGYEQAVQVDEALELMPADVEELLKLEQKSGTQQAIGKICLDFKWYLACVFDETDMIKFEGVKEVSLDIPFVSAETIPATVAATNPDPDTGQTAVIFECTYMDADIAEVRNEAVQVKVNTYSGVLVNEKALRFYDVEYQEEQEDGSVVTKVKENVKGVYVVYGGQLDFVQVFTEKDVNGYAVCKLELSEEEQANLVTDHTIRLYDQVVIGGTDLYDGKIVK